MLLVEWDGNSHVGDTIAIVVVHARVIRCKFWSFFFLFFLDSCLTVDFSDPGLAAQDVVGFGKVYMRVGTVCRHGEPSGVAVCCPSRYLFLQFPCPKRYFDCFGTSRDVFVFLRGLCSWWADIDG